MSPDHLVDRPDTLGRDVPELYRGIAAQARRSRAAAVKLFCLECVGFARADVANCTARRCPLFAWRPYQRGDDDATPEISGGNGARTRATHAPGI